MLFFYLKAAACIIAGSLENTKQTFSFPKTDEHDCKAQIHWRISSARGFDNYDGSKP